MDDMRGSYRGEDRAAAREHWRLHDIPQYADLEIRPLLPFLANKPAITAIDGGANKGFWSKALLNTIGNKISHIYMIDASPENIEELTRRSDNLIFDDEDFAKLSSINIAVGAEAGTLDFFTNDEGSPIGSLYPHTINGASTLGQMPALTIKTQVKVETLDAIIAAHRIPHVDLLKLDIEGNEFNALKGAERSMAAGMIDVIMFEFGVHQVDARNFFRDFWGLLTPYGYKLYKVGNCEGHLVPEYTYHQEVFTECWNFIAVREGADRRADAGMSDAFPLHRGTWAALPGELVFDIGANVGDKTDLFVKRGVRVVAVEPQPKIVAHLRQRFANNPLVTIVPKGVADKPGTLVMSLSDNHTLSTFSNEWQGGRFSQEKWHTRAEIEVTTLDALIAEFGRPRYIKIDVEGFESQVVAGLSGKVDMLSFEFVGEFVEHSKQICRRLEQLGFKRFNLGLGDLTDFVFNDLWPDVETICKNLTEIAERSPMTWGDIYAV